MAVDHPGRGRPLRPRHGRGQSGPSRRPRNRPHQSGLATRCRRSCRASRSTSGRSTCASSRDRLHLEPDLLRPDGLLRPGALCLRPGGALDPALPGRRLPGPAFKPRLSLRLKGGTKRGDHPSFTATLRMSEGGANIAARPGRPAALGLPRPGQHPHDLHPRAVRRQGLPQRLGLRLRQGLDPAARSTPAGPRLPALLRQPAARPGRRPERPDRTSSCTAGPTRSEAGSATPSKASPTPPPPNSSSASKAASGASWSTAATSAGARTAPAAKFTAHSGKVSGFRPLLKAKCGGKGKPKGKKRNR